MKPKNNVVTVDRRLAYKASRSIIRFRNNNDIAVENVMVALYCSDSLYMVIHSEFIYLF